LQVEALDSTLFLRYRGYSKIWSAVQSQAKIAVELGTVTPSQREIALINSRTEFLGVIATVSSLNCVWPTAPTRRRTDLLCLLASAFESDRDVTLLDSARRWTKTPTLSMQSHQREPG